MNICFICPEYPEGPHGGIGTFVQILARELVSEGHGVKVIGVYDKNYPAPDFENDKGVEVWRIRIQGKYFWPLAWYRQYKMIKNWIRSGQIDLIEAPDSRGWFANWGQLPIPLVLRAHGSNTYFSFIAHKKQNKLTRILEERTYQRADFLASVSKYTADLTSEIFNLKKEFTIIYNGIYLPPFEKQVRLPNKIIFAGTLIEKKGVIQLIKAANLLHSRGVEFTLEIFGKDTFLKSRGSMKAYLLDLIHDDDLRSLISINDYISRKELLKKYYTATVAVFPSYMEAFALAPIESMACGCPTIYSSQTSGSELITDGVDGMLIDPDKPEEIADAIKSIFNDKALAEKMGEAGKSRSELFSAKRMTQKSIAFYEDCIKTFITKN